MIWPVLLGHHPRDSTWPVGSPVSTRLGWLDSPDLPSEVLVRREGIPVRPLLTVDGEPWAQLIEAGDLRAVREGHLAGGTADLTGCLGFDAFLGLIGDLPATTGTVRRVRLLHRLHDRGPDRWIPRPGAFRLTDVPDAAPGRLLDHPVPDEQPTGTLMFLSPEQYFRLAGDRLPAEQWQASGFLADLDVPGASW